jgi:hypothetical protein
MHVGNTILIDHNHVRMMRRECHASWKMEGQGKRISEIPNGWSPYLFGGFSFHKWLQVHICAT